MKEGIKRKVDIFLICFVIIFWIAICTCSIKKEDTKFSESENRYLTQFPKVTKEKIITGKAQEELEVYLKDQIYGRDNWITIKTFIQKIAGKKEINGVYIGKDGYLFDKKKDADINKEQLERNKQALSEFLKTKQERVDNDNIYIMLVPTASLILEDKLPQYANMFQQNKYIDEIENEFKDYNVIDLRERLEKEKENYLYYKTDHHWTTDGAYLAYQEWCSKTGHKEGEFERKIVCTDFRGSLHAKTLDSDAAFDSIVQYQVKNENANLIQIETDGVGNQNLFCTDKLQVKDKYQFFLGGNYGTAKVEGKNMKGRNILVIKDSFANCFVPFLRCNYKTIFMVDLRYFDGCIEEYMEKNEIDEIMVLYNIANYVTDKNMYKINGRIHE